MLSPGLPESPGTWVGEGTPRPLLPSTPCPYTVLTLCPTGVSCSRPAAFAVVGRGRAQTPPVEAPTPFPILARPTPHCPPEIVQLRGWWALGLHPGSSATSGSTSPQHLWRGWWCLAVGSPFNPAREELGLQDVMGGPAGGCPEAGFHPCAGCSCCEFPKELAIGHALGSFCTLFVYTGVPCPTGPYTPGEASSPPSWCSDLPGIGVP